MRIALWGPARCGKSWFIRSISRSIAALRLELAETAELSLTNALGGGALFDTAPPGAPTLAVRDERWALSWRLKSAAVAGLSQRHEFLISDHAGGALVSVGLADQDSDAYRVLSAADAIIALLDVGVSLEGSDELATYRAALERLLGMASARPKPPLVVLCLSKADLLPAEERRGPAQAVVGRVFGPLPGGGPVAPRAFVCSAAGFLDDALLVPNVNGVALRDEAQWAPWQVHQPLLYILEQSERRRLATAGSAVARFLFSRQRLGLHERHGLSAALLGKGNET